MIVKALSKSTFPGELSERRRSLVHSVLSSPHKLLNKWTDEANDVARICLILQLSHDALASGIVLTKRSVKNDCRYAVLH